MHGLPIGSPPVLVRSFGAFGVSVHGLRGPETYRNGFWVLNLVTGGGVVEIEGVAHPFGAGFALLLPPDRLHVYRFDGPVTKTYAHFRTDPAAAAAPFPVARPLGDEFDWYRNALLGCRAIVSAEPERAVSQLWSLLWRLTAGPAGGPGPKHHPVVRGFMDYLEGHLDAPFDPASAAGALGVSTTHLNRLCRAAFGLAPAAWVRRLRLDRAVHLLSHTVDPVADIAARVGIPDLQHFNKLIRRHTGASPRALRRG